MNWALAFCTTAVAGVAALILLTYERYTAMKLVGFAVLILGLILTPATVLGHAGYMLIATGAIIALAGYCAEPT